MDQDTTTDRGEQGIPLPPVDESLRVAVIGLGYVGLPLAIAMGRKYRTVGFDINENRVRELSQHLDTTREVSLAEFESAHLLRFSNDESSLDGIDVFIVAVPTPVDKAKVPDLTPLQRACEALGRHIAAGGTFVVESTVFPGATREVCVPIVEQASGLRLNETFYCGYSPERINPGDKAHKFEQIIKITSGSSSAAAEFIDDLYSSVVLAGTHRAESIEIAEAAKVIENTQRDLNIALVNELAMIFQRLNIPTAEVLSAAATKWNFLDFKPGLVGGHCIGVDPYYLTYRAEQAGYSPNIILAGRKTNDGMPEYIASVIIKLMIARDVKIRGARAVVLGCTFKENVSDMRNSKVIDLVASLRSYQMNVDVYDPLVDASALQDVFGPSATTQFPDRTYDLIILAVPHDDLARMTPHQISEMKSSPTSVVFDIKGKWPVANIDGRL